MGKYWPYHDRLFAEQPRFEREALIQYAGDLGLERTAFTRCLDERRFSAVVDKDISEGRAVGVNATPTFIINDQPFVGAHSLESFRTIIDGALRDKH
jgi:protein-disulfide isomerase